MSPITETLIQLVNKRQQRVVVKAKRSVVDTHMQTWITFLGQVIEVESAAPAADDDSDQE